MKNIERRPWRCPGCNRLFKIPISASDPDICPDCETTSGKATDESDGQRVGDEAMSGLEARRDFSIKSVLSKFSEKFSTRTKILTAVCVCLYLVFFGALLIPTDELPSGKEWTEAEQHAAMLEYREKHPVTQDASNYPNTFTQSKKWFEGGTLHDSSALAWQNASYENKLATCGDFVTAMWQSGNLRPAIANDLSNEEDVEFDDLRPYAIELVSFLDAAIQRDPDPELNRKMFANQTVAGFAAIGMVTMGWTK